jgi:hypothetical protein
MSGITHGVDYVTEREALAIRCNYGWRGDAKYNPEDMTMRLPLRDGVVVLPRETVLRYHEDWLRSGFWSLPGLKDDLAPPPPVV